MAGAERQSHGAAEGMRVGATVAALAATIWLASLAGLTAFPAAASAQAGDASTPMRLSAFATPADTGRLLEGAAGAWEGAAEQPVLLNRTPPLYEGDPQDDGMRPTATVSIARARNGTLVRLRWTDPTDNRPRPPERVPDGGDPHVYKQHSVDIERFSDAACVMLPSRSSTSAPWPSLVMGEAGSPVDLYYWHGVRGFQQLQAAGRGTTQTTGQPFTGSARRTATGWEVVFGLPEAAAALPMAFAIWDGQREHRDGLKWFSPWYEVAP